MNSPSPSSSPEQTPELITEFTETVLDQLFAGWDAKHPKGAAVVVMPDRVRIEKMWQGDWKTSASYTYPPTVILTTSNELGTGSFHDFTTTYEVVELDAEGEQTKRLLVAHESEDSPQALAVALAGSIEHAVPFERTPLTHDQLNRLPGRLRTAPHIGAALRAEIGRLFALLDGELPPATLS